MRFKRLSAPSLASLLAAVVSGIFLSSCIRGGAGNDLAFPVVTLSPASTSVQAGGTVQFTATVVSQASTTITWAVNNLVGGNPTVGTVSSTGLYTAPAVIPNPATVTIKAISSAETNPFGSAIVKITAAVSPAVTVSPNDSSTTAGGNIQFTATVSGTTNTAVNWSVGGVAGGNSTVGTISSSGAYTAPTTVPAPPTVVVTATSQADASQSASTTVTVTASNTVPLFVNFGPNGDTGNPRTDYYNGLFTAVTICVSGTVQCQTIPDIIVDTNSVGLRVLNSALTTVPATELDTIMDSQQNQIEECIQFGDTSYVWGPILFADVVMGGERAYSVPIQVAGDTTYTVPAPSCLPLGNGPSLNTVAALGANGILGVGTFVQDCGLNCAGGQTFSPYPYYVCPHQTCRTVPVPVAQQVANPVAFFAKDNNGVEFSLPSISATGAQSLPYTSADGSSLVPAGLLIFGVGTQSNNSIGSATLYSLDANGNLPTVTYNGNAYNSEGVLDAGANALYILDAQTLGTQDCPDNPYYCPSSPLALSLGITGANGSSGTVTLNIESADTLFANSPGYAAFNNLAGPSGESFSTDYFDLGLPFFFGRNVFVGIEGTTVPNSASAPNGYFAF